MDRHAKAGKPFFCWLNSTRMHLFTHLKKEAQGVTGLGNYADGIVGHEGSSRPTPENSTTWGIADNTIVMWSTGHGVRH